MVCIVTEMVRSVINHKQNDWVNHLTAIEFVYHNRFIHLRRWPRSTSIWVTIRSARIVLISFITAHVQTTTELIEALDARQVARMSH
jgi:hypothetical protein